MEDLDHCRIGSLESTRLFYFFGMFDHCRIGSLEISSIDPDESYADHCRIGSLERLDDRPTADAD